MQSSRRPKTLIEAERHSLEFTSGQLIIAICGLLFLWLVGFLMGVMAGRLELGSSLAEGKTPAGATQTASKPDSKAAPTPKASPAPKPPAKDIPPAPPAPKPAETKVAEAKPAAPVDAKPAEAKKPEPDVKYVTERPDRPTLAATQTQAEAATPEAAKPAEAAPAPVAAAAPVAPVEEAKPAEKAETPKTEVAEKPKEETAPKADPKSSGKTYTVQVFSVKAQNRSNADEYVSLLKQNSGQTADVVKSKDGKHYNVVIGRFPDRKAAEEKRDELKKKAGFADCIVREIAS